MMKKHLSGLRLESNKRAMHWMVPALFLCSALFSQASTNWVSGAAYGTDFSALATAVSIDSVASTNGSLIIGYTNTINLTLSHDITGFVIITNQTSDFKVNATGALITGSDGAVFSAMSSSNLVITGGRFVGTASAGSGEGPPLPGLEEDADGGYITNSTATISGSEFAGVNGTDGFVMEHSELVVSNGIFRGGSIGAGLVARDNSTVTIHTGSFTGGVGNTAFYLQDSDVTVYDGTFTGNIGETNIVVGDGLFSKLTDATTNHINLHGGTFSSLGFFGEDGSVQHFLAGTNLTIQSGIIQNGGTVIVDNQNDNALQDLLIFSGTMDFTTNTFSLHDGGVLGFGITATTNGFLMADTTTFESNSTLFVDANGAVFEIGSNDINLLETASGIFVSANGTNTIANTTNFNANVDIDLGTANDWLTAFDGAFIDFGKTLRLRFTTGNWGDAWNTDGPPKVLANELEGLDDGTMAPVVTSMSSITFQTTIETTYFTTYNTFQIAMQGLQAALGQSVSRGAEFREQLKLIPLGAKGPTRNNELRGWAKYYGQFYSHDAEGLNQEYDATLHGGTFGIDKSIGNLLLGIGGGSGRYSTTSSTDGEENITAYQGALYGTYGTVRAFFDAGIAYGFNEVETQTDGPFVLNGEFDANILSAYFGGGYDLVDTKGGTVFTPEASIQYSVYEQDAYSETSDTAVPRNIDAFDADSLRSSLGMNISMLNKTAFETFGFKLDGRFHWLHEFNPEPGNMSFSLEGGSNDYQLAHPLLDEELFRAGFGFSFFNTKRNQPKNVLLRLDFDELFGDGFNSHNLSAKVIYAF